MENQTFKFDKAQLQARQAVLETVKNRLKQDFVGIDDIIDNLIDYIRIWYLIPEILTRPIIVCLWGMTGVGKTDLVRKLVQYLEFSERFVEIELGNTDQTTYHSSVSAIFKANNLIDSKPAIVLFDEIQRFYTIESDGSPVGITKFNDFWELLSDGRLARREKDDLDFYLNEFRLNQRRKNRRNGEAPDSEEDPMLQMIGLWEAQRFKEMLNFEEDLVDLAEMNRMQVLERLLDKKVRRRAHEPVDHSQTLILISGNLDEAFQMATHTSDSEVDADIYHAFTKKITAVNIKNALTRRFRPEQVARFGNIHLIYPSLRRCDFDALIRKEVDKILERTVQNFGIQIRVTEAIYQLIYRNGVFPVQGVRPVFSSVTDILETHLSKFMFEALHDDSNSLSIDYEVAQKCIIADTGIRRIEMPFVGRIDKIRQSNLDSAVANVSVHEAGHAVAYLILFGLAPLQLKSKVASSYAGGFTFPHEIYETRESIIKKIKVFLAGGLAEELIFGKDNATIGRSNDREQVTLLAADFLRRYGFDERFQANYTLEYGAEMDKFKTDEAVEDMVKKAVQETRELLEQHRALLLAIARPLQHKGSLEAAEVAEIARERGYEAAIREEGYLHLPGYDELLK